MAEHFGFYNQHYDALSYVNNKSNSQLYVLPQPINDLVAFRPITQGQKRHHSRPRNVQTKAATNIYAQQPFSSPFIQNKGSRTGRRKVSMSQGLLSFPEGNKTPGFGEPQNPQPAYTAQSQQTIRSQEFPNNTFKQLPNSQQHYTQTNFFSSHYLNPVINQQYNINANFNLYFNQPNESGKQCKTQRTKSKESSRYKVYEETFRPMTFRIVSKKQKRNQNLVVASSSSMSSKLKQVPSTLVKTKKRLATAAKNLKTILEQQQAVIDKSPPRQVVNLKANLNPSPQISQTRKTVNLNRIQELLLRSSQHHQVKQLQSEPLILTENSQKTSAPLTSIKLNQHIMPNNKQKSKNRQQQLYEIYNDSPKFKSGNYYTKLRSIGQSSGLKGRQSQLYAPQTTSTLAEVLQANENVKDLEQTPSTSIKTFINPVLASSHDMVTRSKDNYQVFRQQFYNNTKNPAKEVKNYEHQMKQLGDFKPNRPILTKSSEARVSKTHSKQSQVSVLTHSDQQQRLLTLNSNDHNQGSQIFKNQQDTEFSLQKPLIEIIDQQSPTTTIQMPYSSQEQEQMEDDVSEDEYGIKEQQEDNPRKDQKSIQQKLMESNYSEVEEFIQEDSCNDNFEKQEEEFLKLRLKEKYMQDGEIMQKERDVINTPILKKDEGFREEKNKYKDTEDQQKIQITIKNIEDNFGIMNYNLNRYHKQIQSLAKNTQNVLNTESVIDNIDSSINQGTILKEGEQLSNFSKMSFLNRMDEDSESLQSIQVISQSQHQRRKINESAVGNETSSLQTIGYFDD